MSNQFIYVRKRPVEPQNSTGDNMISFDSLAYEHICVELYISYAKLQMQDFRLWSMVWSHMYNICFTDNV